MSETAHKPTFEAEQFAALELGLAWQEATAVLPEGWIIHVWDFGAPSA